MWQAGPKAGQVWPTSAKVGPRLVKGGAQIRPNLEQSWTNLVKAKLGQNLAALGDRHVGTTPNMLRGAHFELMLTMLGASRDRRGGEK